MVEQGVVELLGEGVARVEGLNGGVGVVNDVGVTAVGIQGERAIKPLQGRAHGAGGAGAFLGTGAHGHHRALRRCHQVVAVPVVNIAVIGDDVSSGIGAGGAVEGATGLHNRARVVGSNGSIVGALDRDQDHPDVAQGPIGNGVVEGFTKAGAWIQGIHKRVAVVHHIGVGAVGVDGQLAIGAQEWRTEAAGRAGPLGASGAEGGHLPLGGEGVVGGIGIRVVGEHIAAGVAAGGGVEGTAGFDGVARVIHRHGRAVGHQDQGFAAEVVVDAAITIPFAVGGAGAAGGGAAGAVAATASGRASARQAGVGDLGGVGEGRARQQGCSQYACISDGDALVDLQLGNQHRDPINQAVAAADDRVVGGRRSTRLAQDDGGRTGEVEVDAQGIEVVVDDEVEGLRRARVADGDRVIERVAGGGVGVGSNTCLLNGDGFVGLQAGLQHRQWGGI